MVGTRHIFRRSLSNRRIYSDAWILTDGIDTGVSKLVGEGILHHRLLHEYSNEIKCIGLTMWGAVSEKMRLGLKKATRVDEEQKLEHSKLFNAIFYYLGIS